MNVWIFVVRINMCCISSIGPRAVGAGSGHVPEIEKKNITATKRHDLETLDIKSYINLGSL